MGKIIELKTNQTSYIKTLVESMVSYLDDITITFFKPTTYVDKKTNKTVKKNGGLMIKEMNGTHMILTIIRLDNFEEYNYSHKNNSFNICIDLRNLLKCLKCMSNLDTMTWIIEEENIDKLQLILECNEKNEKKIFKLNLRDTSDEGYELDDIDYTYKITMPTVDFQKYIKDMTTVGGKKMEIKCTSSKIFLTSKGDIGNIDFEIGESLDGLEINIDIDKKNEIVQGTFDLKYLSLFTKCTSLCDKIEIYLMNDYPMILSYQVGTLGETKFVVSQFPDEK